MDNLQTAEDFIAMAHKFKLGCLQTEQQHPHTIGLSDLAKTNLPVAINKIKDLDLDTIKVLRSKIPQMEEMYVEIDDVLETGGRVFVCGCGATGRLSLVLEALWRHDVRENKMKGWEDKVVSFMAGGDAALIKSIEDFEDHPEFAEEQLKELGFSQNDLLIGSTEGGQTWWVIGAVWQASKISQRKPFILYGNQDKTLCQNVQRSREFIQSDKIRKINMNVGSMAIAGSTRMQSTTILMYGIGLSLLGNNRMREIKYKGKSWLEYASLSLNTFEEYMKSTDFGVIAQLIEEESGWYEKQQTVSYLTDSYYAISVLTDTTERAPTFSLSPFENINDDNKKPCWCNMLLKSLTDKTNLQTNERVKSDWEEMLGGRMIRSLDSHFWQKYKQKVSLDRILGFTMHLPKQNHIQISHPLKFQTSSNLTIMFPNYPLNDILSHHLFMKVILNNLSTLIMGRLCRYESNVMTFVRASNYKLIDRAARMVMMLRKEVSYEDTIRAIYKIKPTLDDDQPIVLRVIEWLDEEKGKGEGKELGLEK